MSTIRIHTSICDATPGLCAHDWQCTRHCPGKPARYSATGKHADTLRHRIQAAHSLAPGGQADDEVRDRTGAPAPSTTPAAPASLQLALSRHAKHWYGADGAGFVELLGWDVSKRLADPVRLTWRGDQASAFWRAHEADLRAGRVLYIGHGPLHARESHFEARVTSCTLAPLPPSWLKHAESSEQAQASSATPSPTTHHQPTGAPV